MCQVLTTSTRTTLWPDVAERRAAEEERHGNQAKWVQKLCKMGCKSLSNGLFCLYNGMDVAIGVPHGGVDPKIRPVVPLRRSVMEIRQKQVQKLCKMGCLLVKWVVLLVKWVVHMKWDGFGNFQSLFIIFLSFSMSNGPTQLQLYQVISAPTGPILVKLVSNSS